MSQPLNVPVPPAPGGTRDELDFVAELCGVVASNTELRPILDWIVQGTTARLGADEGSIKLIGPESGPPTARTLIRKHQPGLDSGSWESPVTMCVMGYLQVKGEGFASPDLLDDDRFPALRKSQSRVRAVLAVPLRVEGRITGMLAVTNRTPGHRWSESDMRMLGILATHSAGVIEQARLRVENEAKKELERQKELMERELNYAREIQMSLVPASSLTCGPWEIHGKVVPARQVGGDYYDFFPLGEERFGVTLADVSGKGVPASLMMANVQGLLRAFCDGERGITDAIRHINRSVFRASSGGKFITLFYGEVDYAAGLFRYTNAGHNYPYLRRADGSLVELDKGGLLLGLFDDAEYELGEIPFAPGDGLILFSDGIPEATDSRGDLYGEERLQALWRDAARTPTGEVIERLLADVGAFRGSAGQSDDMTIVVVGPRAGA
jgi:phosphoserine phosphatase RsbU/P